MKQLKKTLLTLVALLAVTTGAWATASVKLTTAELVPTDAWNDNLNVPTKDEFPGFDGISSAEAETWDGAPASFDEPVNTWLVYKIDGDMIYVAFFENGVFNSEKSGSGEIVKGSFYRASHEDGTLIYYTTGASGNAFPITWSATTPNTASIEAMPAGNVTVRVKYFPQAEFAMSTDATPVALAPAAIDDVPATTDGPIVTPGTVKNIGTSEVPQGTLMYYVSTTPMTDAQLQALTPDKWSADVPTAESLAEGQAYVYYYIKGAEPATIAERTDANTCSDGDILAANVVNVTLAAAPLWNAEFDLTNAPEEDKAPGVWSTDIPKGGVVKGTEVTVTYTGTKKVLGVKAEKVKVAEGHALTSAKLGEIVCSDGKAYAAADKDILPKGVKAEALVCYVVGNGHGLALALADEGEMKWSTAIETCAAHTPAFTGGTWKLASQGEWNNMINAAGGFGALRDGFSSVGGTNMQSDLYWSSTDDDDRAQTYNFSYGEWDDNEKTWSWYVRACLTF